MGLSLEQLEQLLPEAYKNLYDLVWLRTSDLASALVQNSTTPTARERAWQVHYLLLSVVDQLAEIGKSRPYSHEWRQYKALKLRYVDGLPVTQVAADLGISRRVYYREQKRAIAAAALVLEGLLKRPDPVQEAAQEVAGTDGQTRADLLRSEARNAMGNDQSCDVCQVLRRVIDLLQSMLENHRLEIELALPKGIAPIRVELGLLRQLVMACLGQIVEHSSDALIQIRLLPQRGCVVLSIACLPKAQAESLSIETIEQTKAMLADLADVADCAVAVSGDALSIDRVILSLPVAEKPVVLVIDDNEDMIDLMRRYLSPEFQVVSTHAGENAFGMAKRLHPHAVTLDLMMPEVDGWDLLQQLTNDPNTCDIPVVVCSVLKACDLALAMGASGFAEKPIVGGEILSLLRGLAT